jgi:hypothetical protein
MSKQRKELKVRLPEVLAKWLEKRAAEEHRSVNGQVTHTLQIAHDAEAKR